MIDKIVQTIGIEKIRIVFADGVSRDYELKGNYQKDFTAGLAKSLKAAKQEAIRIAEQGIDSDF